MSNVQYFYTKVPTRQYNPQFTKSYVVGRRLVVSASSGSHVDEYTPTFSGSLIKMGIHVSSYTDGDYWNLSGSDWHLCNTIYTKSSIPESFVFDIGQDLVSGSKVYLNFYNSGNNAKTVWIDYYFIR